MSKSETQPLADDAARERFLFHLGIHTSKAVISWADARIESEDAPPFSLLDLATTSLERTERFIELLSELSQGCDFWSATRSALGDVYIYVLKTPEDAERVAANLWMAASWGKGKTPGDLHFIHRFEDAFYLAREEGYGTEAEVRQDLISELRRFKK